MKGAIRGPLTTETANLTVSARSSPAELGDLTVEIAGVTAELSGKHLAGDARASTAEQAVSGQDWPRGNPYNDRHTHLNRRAKIGGRLAAPA